MSLILTKAQATAVYDAMCALNNVGGRLDVDLQTIRVLENPATPSGLRGCIEVLTVRNGAAWEGETYTDQAAFAAAYGINS